MKLNRLQKIILGVLVFFLMIGLLLQGINGNTTSNLGYDAFTMLKYSLIDHPVETIKEWTHDFASLWSVKKENDILRYELSQAPSYQAKYEDAQRRITELEEALDLKGKERYESIAANVVSRDTSTSNDRITIDKGSKDGIVEGMAVESVKGMIGKVESTSDYTSVVKLLTSEDKKSNASIKINIDEKHSSDGILYSYDVKKGVYVVYLYDDTDKVKKGMQVVTSGKGGVYPSGLLVGTVDSIQSLNNQTGQTIYVRPIDDMQEFSIVRVIGSKKGE